MGIALQPEAKTIRTDCPKWQRERGALILEAAKRVPVEERDTKSISICSRDWDAYKALQRIYLKRHGKHLPATVLGMSLVVSHGLHPPVAFDKDGDANEQRAVARREARA